MNRFKLALAGLAAVGGALVASPEPAQAGGFGFSVGFGHPGYYGGYYPASYGWGYPAYYRPRRVVYGYPRYYHRPVVRRVAYGYPGYYYRRPVRRVFHRPAYYARPVGYHRRAWW